MKSYEPVREFERQTSYCPLYVAWRIVDEAQDYFRVPMPQAYADELANRAERVFAAHPFWRREVMGARGYGHILAFMRHWLSGVLAREKPALFRQLPESFKIGRPLPMEPRPMSPQSKPRTLRLRRRELPVRCFVHGAEFLPV